MEGVMTPGRPSPPPQGSTGPQVEAIVGTCGARPVRATEYAVRVCDSEPRGMMEKRRRFLPPAQQHDGEQPGRERPHLWTLDPDPRASYGVAHVPAACLRSCDGLRTPMSRTIDLECD